jgi:O-antigen ligase
MNAFFLLDQTGKTFAKKEKLLYFLLAALVVSFFLPDMPVVGNIFIGAIMFHSFFYNSWAEKKQLLLQRKGIFLMLIFFLFNIVSAFISANLQEGMSMLVLRLPLLIFPLCIGLIYIREELKDRFLIAFCLLTTLMGLVCMIYSIYRFIMSADAGYLYDDSLSEAVRRQSIYIALTVNLALFGYVYLLSKGKYVMKYAWLTYLSIAFLLVFHFMLASRIAILTLYSCMIVYAIFRMVRKKKILEGASLIIGLFIGAFILVHFFPKTLNRFKELQYPGYSFTHHGIESHYNMKVTPEQWNGANIRLAVWKCGWDLAGQHWLTGVPLGDKEDKLVEVFKTRNFDFAASSRRNMHNNYLDILCNFGLIGLGVFLLGYMVFPLAGCYRTRDGLGLFIILAFTAAYITENWFDSSFGCILSGFFLCFVAAYKTDDQ